MIQLVTSSPLISCQLSVNLIKEEKIKVNQWPTSYLCSRCNTAYIMCFTVECDVNLCRKCALFGPVSVDVNVSSFFYAHHVSSVSIFDLI